MGLFKYIEIFMSFVSVISGATAALFAYLAIKENKKNAFIHHKYSLALTLKELLMTFDRYTHDFKISKNNHIQKTMLDSEYYINPEMYKKFKNVIFELKELEGEPDIKARMKKSKDLRQLIKDIKIDFRLDE